MMRIIIEDDKIKQEQDKLMNAYFKNEPECYALDQWIEEHASQYFKDYMKELKTNKKSLIK